MDAAGNSINLYNIRANRLIETAAVKGQCSRNYWYGDDGVLEGLLGRLEGLFGRLRREADAGTNDVAARAEIKRFMYLQHWRTARAAERIKHSHEAMDAESWAPTKSQRSVDIKQHLISAMKFGLFSREMVEDLKIRFVDNNTSLDFVVGDDPSVLLNRFAYEKLDDAEFGVASAGLLMVMPLSPRLSAIAYDGQVYSLALTNARLVLSRPTDVDAFNEIQMLAALENIYYKDPSMGGYIQNKFLAIKHQRRPLATARSFVPDGDDPNVERYKPGTKAEAFAAKRSLIAINFNHPQPKRWLPGLRYRAKPRFFYNGTGMGHVRRAEWLKKDGLPRPKGRLGKSRLKPMVIRMK